jgi:hypothetical protein
MFDSRSHPLRRALGVALVGLLAAACAVAPTPAPPTPAPPAPTPAAFTNAFAYCAAVGNVDAPDARFTGAKVPDEVAQALFKTMQTSPSFPIEQFARGTVWRCMGGKVMGCQVGANLPCSEKADISRTPTSGMAEFCTANPASDFIPAAVTGRATVYQWRCTSGAPAIVKQMTEVDAQGFLSTYWYLLSP